MVADGDGCGARLGHGAWDLRGSMGGNVFFFFWLRVRMKVNRCRSTSLRNKDDGMTDLSVSTYEWKCRTSRYFSKDAVAQGYITSVFSLSISYCHFPTGLVKWEIGFYSSCREPGAGGQCVFLGDS